MPKFRKGDCARLMKRYARRGEKIRTGKVVTVIGEMIFIQYGGYGGKVVQRVESMFVKARCPRLPPSKRYTF